MKHWRRTSRHEPTGSGLLSAPVTSMFASETVEASGLHQGDGAVFIEWQLALDAGGPWGPSTFDAIGGDPQNVDVSGAIGQWFRCRVDAVGPVAISDWSTPLLVT